MEEDKWKKTSGRRQVEEDKWKKYFLNSKMQVCRAKITVVYPPFDPRELK